MSVKAIPHLNFRNSARQALSFYHTVFGGNLSIISYQDAGNVTDPAEANNVMWGQVVSDSGFRVMAYDVPGHTTWEQGDKSVFVVVEADTAEEITAYWEKLSGDSTILQALAPAQWASLYGMLKDCFGVVWVMNVVSPYQAS
ncbi:VOC family protein [Undibacterium sp. TJN19]|uniref:VOC family protein n=1 Tax=Undibacterium sp. TJN19 TaxID=3413055 RepID=UPI003BF20E53